MPVNKVGYRPWRNSKTPAWSRWWIISETGFRIAFKSAWVRRILLLCWLPVLYWGLGIFLTEQAIQATGFGATPSEIAQRSGSEQLEEQIRQEAVDQFAVQLDDELEFLPQKDALLESINSNDKQHIRHTIWSWLLMTFFRYPQGTAMLFLLGFIVPGLISQDVRSRAFLVYFSRPIGRLGYLLGKFFVPASFLTLVTLIPALCLYLFGVILSPDLTVLYATWDVPLKTMGAAITLIIPTCCIALMLSSLTQESRFATFAWFAIWALGHAAWFAIVITQAFRTGGRAFEPDVMNSDIVRQWSVVSLYNNLSAVQSWVFGFESFEEIWPSLAVLVALTIGSLILLYRGISAPIRI